MVNAGGCMATSPKDTTSTLLSFGCISSSSISASSRCLRALSILRACSRFSRSFFLPLACAWTLLSAAGASRPTSSPLSTGMMGAGALAGAVVAFPPLVTFSPLVNCSAVLGFSSPFSPAATGDSPASASNQRDEAALPLEARSISLCLYLFLLFASALLCLAAFAASSGSFPIIFMICRSFRGRCWLSSSCVNCGLGGSLCALFRTNSPFFRSNTLSESRVRSRRRLPFPRPPNPPMLLLR
mmetsp:Transcript_4132/g.8475  ORF Transcript_4132/g.8475 Transcript_4132/m.8475 type:complete len:242 (-) Transcript_4132:231-956(-)